MTTLLLVLFFFLLAFAGLAIGVILRKKSLRGGCGGPTQGACKEGSCACSGKDEAQR
ncbi:MAG: hypothetical protein Q7U44_00705 [Desulfuromonadales bacterium]|nr:hypothetical protein [Desulfuromonadales bacterium]